MSPGDVSAGKTFKDTSTPNALSSSMSLFIDETWIKTDMAPLRGWGPKGQRLRGFARHGKWRTMTFLAARRCDQLTAPCVTAPCVTAPCVTPCVTAPCMFDGPINGEGFRAYVNQQPVPTLEPDDIVIMDNPGGHKSKAVCEAI